jgi:hypothetical protein
MESMRKRLYRYKAEEAKRREGRLLQKNLREDVEKRRKEREEEEEEETGSGNISYSFDRCSLPALVAVCLVDFQGFFF